MNDEIQFMIRRFPTHREKILEAYQRNEEFKTLCDDFYSSAMMLKRQKNKIIRDKKSEVEYHKLFLDLEGEVIDFLELPADEDDFD